ncbi:GbpC/Spa domain-containing protein [Convivina praedatoris]|uniref:Gram-positive cocci surface proteins LPxTG domain-containing protein n=1 Tax=Convivina praedatoris TaxID=2880963 RepID=A0ABN8H8X0_9LACO|nr:GbpC/Spa domain-containing protein [Convivina sp. LMG 32447]CAH1851874.1 hypothetical protein R077815_00423 [Convivina sp. LMG 32447]CAH1853943.1 hypothetical protein LMG032447_00755 [Convivina sp. LMG 32447]CAH1854100.1 hypothetical protein R078138_00807 [Convivina sp. LMG 32447]
MGKYMKHTSQPVVDGLNTKTKFALGLLSVTGVTGIGLFGQNQIASADNLTSTAVNNQAQNIGTTSTQASQATKQNEKSKVASPNLDQAVKNAQDAGLKTQEVAGNNYPGRIDDYSNLVNQANADYQKQVDTINQQINQKQQNLADQKAAQQSNGDVQDAAQTAQKSGVNVIKDTNQSVKNLVDVQKDNAEQVKQIKETTAQQEQQNQTTSQLKEGVTRANADVEKAANDAKNAGVILKTTDNKKDFTLAELQADKEQQLNQLKTAQEKQLAAQKEYEIALEKVNATNQANAAAYAKAQAAYLAAKQKNAELKSAYEKAVVDYDTKKSELVSKTHEKGYASELLMQALHLGSEENAKSDLTYTGKVTRPIDSDAPNGQKGYYKTQLTKGDTITVSYTNLSNSSYRDQKISKIVRTFTYGDNVNQEPIEMYIGKNPVLNVWYNSSINHSKPGNEVSGDYKRQIIETETFFDQDGKQITFDKDAIITVGSLNNWSENADKAHIEKVRIENARFIPITGGSISDQGSGWAFASKDNSTQDTRWDDISSKDFYVGSSIYQLNSGATEIKSILETDSGSKDTNIFTWAQSSTFVPVGTLPQEPVEPTYVDVPKDEPKVPEKVAEPVKPTAVQSEYHLYDQAAAKDPLTVHYHQNDLVNKEDPTVDYHYNTVEIKDTGSESASVSSSTSKSESTVHSESTKQSISNSTSISTNHSLSDSISTVTSESTSKNQSTSSSQSTSTVTSMSQSKSTHDSISNEGSNSASKSNSMSTSTNISTSNSVSSHESTSESEYKSISTSTQQSISGSVSTHVSISDSTSIRHSTSASQSGSISASTSNSISNDQSKSVSTSGSTSASISNSISSDQSKSASISGSTSISTHVSTSNSISNNQSKSASTSGSISASTSNSTSSDQSNTVSQSNSISTSNYPSTSTQQSISGSMLHSLSDSLSTSNSQIRSESNTNTNGSTSESTIAPKPIWDNFVPVEPKQTSTAKRTTATTLPKTGENTKSSQSHSADVAFFLGLSAGVGALGLMGRRRKDQ